MSDCSGSPSDCMESQPPKRKATSAGLDGNTTGRSVKRRASKACQCCRARKVRCNVTEHGAPCTNCRLDEVECIVSESRRKKKWNKDDDAQAETTATTTNVTRKLASRDALDSVPSLKSVSSRASQDAESRINEHVPHSIYQSHGHRNFSVPNISDVHRRMSVTSQINGLPTFPFTPFSNDDGKPFLTNFGQKLPSGQLPRFIKPLPAKIGPEEISYLEKKGALTVPKGTLRSEMLRAYIEFVHPYMPLLDLHDFLTVIDRSDGSKGKVSLILFQAVMFAGSAFVDMSHLRSAGYATRKEARKDFFQKTRILYDFDYESDRVSLVQALLLLTYYYETPDDQKDTWHWMGVATSVAHTIGLHRNPDNTNLDSKRVKLWKRIWWSTYMRDRLIALGMRRPTRIKSEDFDVPMLTLDDFEIAPIPDSITCIPADCKVARDADVQRQLAVMCIEKARLCLCISHVLSKQYCVLNNNHGLQNDRTTMMLLPKKLDPATSEVKACDEELQNWVNELAEEAKYTDNPSGEAAIDLARALLHMVFFTTLSALHRPQVLPNSQGGPASAPPKHDVESDILDASRRNVRRAASAITSIAQRLDTGGLVKYLPTTGVTVLLPAIIIHLLDIKAPEEETRRNSLRGFCQCMAVMGKLRDLYAAADYSVAFLEAAIRKAGIHVAPTSTQSSPTAKTNPVTSVEDLVDAGRRLDLVNATTASQQQRSTLTPPPDAGTTNMASLEKMPGRPPNVTDEEVARRLETFLASTPPDSDHEHHDQTMTSITISEDTPLLLPTAPENMSLYNHNSIDAMNKWSITGIHENPFSNINHHQDNETLFSSLPLNNEFDDGDFDSLLNLDAVGETFTFDDGVMDHSANLTAELGDVDWLGTTHGMTVDA
ncbi:cutinase transcription factor 1 beta [Stagonosporopsis vannaccii]|nr:cutinase transcription factor 1 beta [Stagonosporopsis vannaccii]